METSGERHFLFSGQLFGVTGMEVWTEYLTYLGDDNWEMTIVDYPDGDTSEQTSIEPFNTESLVQWVLERGAEELDELEEEPSEHPIESENAVTRQLLTHGERLLEIARQENVQSCVDMLEGWLAGTWPPEPEAPRILRVTGVTKRGVWIRVYRAVYSVETDAGPGYLYPPNESGESHLELKSQTSSSKGWKVKLSDELLGELSGFKRDFEALEKS